MLDSTVECWIDDFETWLSGGGGTGSFPSSNLNADLKLFIKTNEGLPHFYKNLIGLIEENSSSPWSEHYHKAFKASHINI